MTPRTKTGDRPTDPIAAVTHEDPYPYYGDLAATRSFDRDETLGLWVACSAAAVTDVLTSPACVVRPPAEPVPRALLGSPAGAIFGRLVRMNDGSKHAAIKPSVSSVTARIEASIGQEARRWAAHLAKELQPASDPAAVSEFAFRLSPYVLASVLGVPPDMLPSMADWVHDFTRCIAPAATSEQLARGGASAGRLLDAFGARLAARGDSIPDGPLGDLDREITHIRQGDRDDVVANGIGFLSQAYEATAGLIGNTLVALGRHRLDRRADRLDDDPLGAVLREVVRHDPPVQNTRRFLTRDAMIGGRTLKAGEAVLVVLAAANRDPLANPEPERFDPFRPAREAFTFGVGPHACPGEAVAIAIAAAGVRELLGGGVEPERLVDHMTYRPSANTRIPLFTR